MNLDVFRVVAHMPADRKDVSDFLSLLESAGLCPVVGGCGEIITHLPYEGGNKFSIPKFLPNDLYITMNVAEHGGAVGNDRVGVVVCGLSGKPLRPYRQPKSWRPGTPRCQAYFSMSTGCTMVQVNAANNATFIAVLMINRPRKDLVVVERVDSWGGPIGVIPKKRFAQYRPAAQAALEKARCVDCWCIHYKEGENDAVP